MKALALRILMVALTRGGASALQFAVLIVIGQVFGVAVLGGFAVVQYSTMLFGTVAAWGAPQLAMRRSANLAGVLSGEERGTLRGITLLVLAGGAAVTGIMLGAGLLGLVDSWRPDPVFLLTLLSIAGFALFKLHAEVAKGLGAANLSLFLEFGAPYIPVLAVVPLALWLPGQALLIFTAAYAVAFLGMLLFLVRRNLGGLPVLDRAQAMGVLRDHRGELTTLMAVQMGMQALTGLPTLMAADYLGEVEAGYVATVTKLAGLSYMIASVISAMFSQKVYAAFRSPGWPGAKALLRQTALANFAANLVVMGMIALLAPQVLGLFGLTPDAAAEVSGTLRLVLAVVILRALLGTPAMFLIGMRRAGRDLLGLLMGAALFVVVLLLAGVTPVTLLLASAFGLTVRMLNAAVAALKGLRAGPPPGAA